MRLLGNVRCWHKADMLNASANVRFQRIADLASRPADYGFTAQGLISAQPNSDGSEFDEREIIGGEFVISGAPMP
jgi:hypothetical protein